MGTLGKGQQAGVAIAVLAVTAVVVGVLVWHFELRSSGSSSVATPTPSRVPPEQPFALWQPQPQLNRNTAPCPGPFQNASDFAKSGAGTIDASNGNYGTVNWGDREKNCAAPSSTGEVFFPPLPPYPQEGTENLFGPTWDDYKQAHPGYACGPAVDYTKDTAFAVGGDWSLGESTALEQNCVTGNSLGHCFLENGGDGMLHLEGGCCCPQPDSKCNVQPRFNWILSVCQGRSCNGDWVNNADDLKTVKTYGSQLTLNYVAAYNFDDADSRWKIVSDSSFNTDGSRGAYDCLQAYGGLGPEEAWLTPVPGGAVQWATGFSPVGAEGVGPLATRQTCPNLIGNSKGMMFVISTERCFNMAWFMLNQANLDRGGGSPACDNLENCWGAANSSEIDFLESPFAANTSVELGYRRMYFNSFNQVGRSNPEQLFGTDREGAPPNANANGGWGGNWETSAFVTGSDPATYPAPDPFVYVAVVDSVGSWVYKIPGDQANTVWPGLTRTTALPELDAAPAVAPEQHQPNYDPTKYSVMFVPSCQATKWGGPAQFDNPTGAYNQGCWVNGNQGFCQNWFQLLGDTGQWKWTASDQYSRELLDQGFISQGGPRRSDNKPLCPDGRVDPACDGVDSPDCDLSRKWCQPMPWNRQMEPYRCRNPYTSLCEYPTY